MVSHIKSISVFAHNNSFSGNSQMLQFFKKQAALAKLDVFQMKAELKANMFEI